MQGERGRGGDEGGEKETNRQSRKSGIKRRGAGQRVGELGGKGEETGEVSRRQQANEQEKVGRREKCSVGGRRGGDEGRRSVMKWQTACQTGSEILTDWMDGSRPWKEGKKRNDRHRMTDLLTS